jgi:hypothetical protein
MIVYRVYYKNSELKKGDLIGMLIERRKSLKEMTRAESGLRWAKLIFGRKVKDEKGVFVVPSELSSEDDARWLMEKGVFTKEELVEMFRLIGQGIK